MPDRPCGDVVGDRLEQMTPHGRDGGEFWSEKKQKRRVASLSNFFDYSNGWEKTTFGWWLVVLCKCFGSQQKLLIIFIWIRGLSYQYCSYDYVAHHGTPKQSTSDRVSFHGWKANQPIHSSISFWVFLYVRESSQNTFSRKPYLKERPSSGVPVIPIFTRTSSRLNWWFRV